MRFPRDRARSLCFALSGAVLCACASKPTGTETDTGEAANDSGRHACFKVSQVSGFRTLDRSNLIVYAPTKSSAYHVRIRPPARELNYANRIAFDAQGTRICGHAGEGIVFDSSGIARKYFVTDIYQLDADAVENLIFQFSGELTIEPQDTAEAEIERDIEPDSE